MTTGISRGAATALFVSALVLTPVSGALADAPVAGSVALPDVATIYDLESGCSDLGEPVADPVAPVAVDAVWRYTEDGQWLVVTATARARTGTFADGSTVHTYPAVGYHQTTCEARFPWTELEATAPAVTARPGPALAVAPPGPGAPARLRTRG